MPIGKRRKAPGEARRSRHADEVEKVERVARGGWRLAGWLVESSFDSIFISRFNSISPQLSRSLGRRNVENRESRDERKEQEEVVGVGGK